MMLQEKIRLKISINLEYVEKNFPIWYIFNKMPQKIDDFLYLNLNPNESKTVTWDQIRIKIQWWKTETGIRIENWKKLELKQKMETKMPKMKTGKLGIKLEFLNFFQFQFSFFEYLLDFIFSVTVFLF